MRPNAVYVTILRDPISRVASAFFAEQRVSATGAVGVEVIDCLYARKFPLTKLVLFGSERSAGKTIDISVR